MGFCTLARKNCQMKNRLLLSLPVLFFFLWSCKSYTPENWPEKRLIFGSGGGFTGAVTEFVLLENGQLFTHVGAETPFRELTRIGRRTTKDLFSKAAQMKELDASVNEPGNIYYFISEWQSGAERRITWGAQDKPVSENVKDFYQQVSRVTTQEPGK